MGLMYSNQHCADLPAQPKHRGSLVFAVTLAALILLVRNISGSQCSQLDAQPAFDVMSERNTEYAPFKEH